MQEPKLFADPDHPDYRPPSSYLDDHVYMQALNGTVRVCADTILYNRERQTVYLAKRCVYPMKGLWVLGGRVQRGEAARDAAARLLEEDTGYYVSPSRLEFLSMNRYWWKTRKQEPTNGGVDDLSYTYALQPTETGLRHIREHLCTYEYDREFGLQEFDYRQLRESKVHPVILDLYKQIFST